jgi:hypothetical protein
MKPTFRDFGVTRIPIHERGELGRVVAILVELDSRSRALPSDAQRLSALNGTLR